MLQPEFVVRARFTSVALLLLGVAAPAAFGQGFMPPPGANVVSVATFGALPNDNTDDTAAIQAALNATVGRSVILYFPDGVYEVSDRLNWGGVGSGAFVNVQGQSEAGTIIKLANNAPGFGDVNNRKVFVDAYEGNTANAFENYLADMTIDVGNGNPGVVALQFQANNTGAIRNVTLKSAGPGRVGVIGLDIAFEFPGPFLASNLTIEGFDTGIVGAPQEYSVTFDNLTLRNQNTLGIYVWRLPLQIRNLQSVNSVPVLSSDSNPGAWGHVVIDGGNLSGGSLANDALINRNSAGVLVVRNLTTSGYRNAVNDLSFGTPMTVADGLVPQFTTDTPATMGGAGTAMLGLTGEPTPSLPAIPTAQWASVKSFGAIENDNLDDTAAIHAALSSGAPVVYFPTGAYYVSKSLVVGPSVQRIEGLKSSLRINAPLATEGGGVFVIPPGSQSVVHISGVNGSFAGPGLSRAVWVSHDTANTLVVRDGDLGGYRNTVQGGRVFLENLVGNAMYFTGQKIWARQLNPEGSTITKVINDGGDFYCLGLKTEGDGVVLETRNRGRSLVLGGLIYPSQPVPDRTQPMFICSNSSLSFSVPESCYIPDGSYAIWCRQIRDGVVTDFTRAMLPLGRGHSVCGGNIALFNSYITDLTPPSVPASINAAASTTSSISIAWAASTDAESGIARYNIYRDNALWRSVMPPSLTVTETGLADSKAHQYAVSAVNGAGIESARSASLSAATIADTLRPQALGVSMGRDPRFVHIVFNKPVALASAAATSSYELRDNVGAPIALTGAVLASDGLSVTLSTTGLTPPLYTLSFPGITDRATVPNSVHSGATTAFAPPPAPSGTGLFGRYYAGRDFIGAPLLSRVDPQIDFAYGLSSPGVGVPADNFCVRWSGQLQAKFDETYTIFIRSDDGARVFIDGLPIISQWRDQGPTEVSAQVTLDSTRTHDLVVEYYEATGGAEVQLSWQSASQPRQVIPAANLSPVSRLVTVRTGDGSGADVQLNRYSTNDAGGGNAMGVFHSPASGGFHVAAYYRLDTSSFALGNNFVTEAVATLSQTFFGIGDGVRQINFFGLKQAANADNWIESGPGHVTWDNAVGNDFSGGLANPSTASFIATYVLNNSGFNLNNQPDKASFSGQRLVDLLNADTDAKVTFIAKRVDASNEGQSWFTKEWGLPTFAPAIKARLVPKCAVFAPAQPNLSLPCDQAPVIVARFEAMPPSTVTWFQNGVAINPVADPRFVISSNSAHSSLVITDAAQQDSGSYYAVVTNACGSVIGPATTITIGTCPCALADVASDSLDTTRNPNGAIGPEDLDAFIAGFIADNASIADVASDSLDTTYNPNNSVGPEDLDAFIASFIAGC